MIFSQIFIILGLSRWDEDVVPMFGHMAVGKLGIVCVVSVVVCFFFNSEQGKQMTWGGNWQSPCFLSQVSPKDNKDLVATSGMEQTNVAFGGNKQAANTKLR